MPGLTGLAGAASSATFTSMLDGLRRVPWLERAEVRDEDRATAFACRVVGRPAFFGHARRGDAILLFEGFFDQPHLSAPAGGEQIAHRLLASFLEHGAAFVERLSGSFQVAVHHGGTTWLYADQLATRRLFYALDGDTLLFSPEIRPLVERLGKSAPDLANLTQFLISGRFFAGETALAAVRSLLPGEILVHRDGRLRRQRYFEYAVEPGLEEIDDQTARRHLEELLDRAILRAFERPRKPAFLLSGGYDSRYLFYTVLQRGPVPPGDLHTLIWGDRLDLPQSDTWISERIARRFGTRHLVLRWGAERVAERFDDLFDAQSGMTEVCLTHVDELAHCGWLRREHGFDALLRGDEIFGPKGEEVRSTRQALWSLGMSSANDIAAAAGWFRDAAPLGAHAERLAALIDGAPQQPADLRDTLYGGERLAALQNQLDAHRAHEVETLNPLLDLGVVRFYRTLPARLRTGKRLFTTSFHQRFKPFLDQPIATEDNSVDWSRAAATLPSLRDFLRHEIYQLPPPLERSTFSTLLEQLIASGGGLPASAQRQPDGKMRLPAVRLVFRAVILGRWLRGWSTA